MPESSPSNKCIILSMQIEWTNAVTKQRFFIHCCGESASHPNRPQHALWLGVGLPLWIINLSNYRELNCAPSRKHSPPIFMGELLGERADKSKDARFFILIVRTHTHILVAIKFWPIWMAGLSSAADESARCKSAGGGSRSLSRTRRRRPIWKWLIFPRQKAQRRNAVFKDDSHAIHIHCVKK